MSLRVNLEGAKGRLRNFEPFEISTGNLRALRPVLDIPDPGHLPKEHWDSVAQASYVVVSYGTPIAWVDEAGSLVVPEYRYSRTTTEHQWAVLHAWKMYEKRVFDWPLVGEGASTGPRSGGW